MAGDVNRIDDRRIPKLKLNYKRKEEEENEGISKDGTKWSRNKQFLNVHKEAYNNPKTVTVFTKKVKQQQWRK